jgi:hypothetical protein
MNESETPSVVDEESVRNGSGDFEEISPKKKRRKKSVVRDIVAIGLVVAAMIGGYVYISWHNAVKVSEVAIQEKVLEFVRTNMVQPGTEVKLTDFAKENGLYRANFSVGTQAIVAYATLDGKTFFPQAIDMDERAKEVANTPPPVSEAETKKDVPDVDLFVMSYCPYGLQMQKGILPVLEKLGSSINFKMRWVGYTMHGKKEFNENIRQYCIDKEEPAKYAPYLSCFAASESGDATGCGKTAKVNEAKIAACVVATDTEFQLTENYDEENEGSSPFGIDKALNDQYGVQGSPTFVVNGTTLSVNRDPASILKAVCSGFTTAPSACSTELVSATPSPGFGVGTASSGSGDASCN